MCPSHFRDRHRERPGHLRAGSDQGEAGGVRVSELLPEPRRLPLRAAPREVHGYGAHQLQGRQPQVRAKPQGLLQTGCTVRCVPVIGATKKSNHRDAMHASSVTNTRVACAHKNVSAGFPFCSGGGGCLDPLVHSVSR